MSINNKKGPGESIMCGETFRKCTSLQKPIKFQSVIKPIIGTCVVCRKVFTESFADRDPLLSRICSQSKGKPAVCPDCDKSFIQTTGLRLQAKEHLDAELQNDESNSECVIMQTGRDIDEQLTNTHISGKFRNDEREEEWVVIKYGENIDEQDTEKSFSIKLCNVENNEECMIIQTGEVIDDEDVQTFSGMVKEVDAEEDMVTQDDELTVTDIIQIGSLTFNNVYEEVDNVYEVDSVYEEVDSVYEEVDSVYEEADSVYEEVDDNFGENVSSVVNDSTTSTPIRDTNETWSVCTNKFTTGGGKLDDWSVCTKGFSIKGSSSLVCQICRKYFKNENDLKFHVLSHSPDKNPSKSVSHSPCKGTMSLDVHDLSPMKREPHSCNTCNKNFSDVGALKIHSRVHSASLPDNSGNMFFKKSSQKGILNRSVSNHSGEKLLTCTSCGMRFQHKHQLAKHAKTHLMLACKVCQRVFKSNAKLKNHMFHVCGKLRGSNQNSREEAIGEKPISSHTCKKSTAFKLKKDTCSDLDNYGEVRDLCSQGGDEKILEKKAEGTKKNLTGKNSNLKKEVFSDISQNEKLCNPAAKGLFAEELINDIKDENFVEEDFPMVEDYYVMAGKDEGPSCSNTFTSNVGR